MPATVHLLERAYQLINANQIQDAEFVLDAVVRVDPQNVKAWKIYLTINQSQKGLDWIKERILRTGELSASDKSKLLGYHLQLTKQLNGREEAAFPREPFNLFFQEERETAFESKNLGPQFELIDMFDYPARNVKSEILSRPRRRAIYNPLAFNAVGMIKSISRTPFGRKTTDHIQKIISLANDLIKNPQGTYTRLSKLPHFELYAEIGLLILFILGVRLVSSSHFSGYIFLGIFVLGARWWLMKFGNRNITSMGSQSRVYLHENKVNLPEITEVDQEQKSKKVKIQKNIKISASKGLFAVTLAPRRNASRKKKPQQ